MTSESEKEYAYCVIIPTYNNENTLKRVIDGVLEYIIPQEIIIVNDGSTDRTPEILKAYPEITQIHFPKNQGKGLGLRKGFKKALEMGFTHAITIDSDGQHFPDDIPLDVSIKTGTRDFVNWFTQHATRRCSCKKQFWK